MWPNWDIVEVSKKVYDPQKEKLQKINGVHGGIQSLIVHELLCRTNILEPAIVDSLAGTSAHSQCSLLESNLTLSMHQCLVAAHLAQHQRAIVTKEVSCGEFGEWSSCGWRQRCWGRPKWRWFAAPRTLQQKQINALSTQHMYICSKIAKSILWIEGINTKFNSITKFYWSSKTRVPMVLQKTHESPIPQ